MGAQLLQPGGELVNLPTFPGNHVCRRPVGEVLVAQLRLRTSQQPLGLFDRLLQTGSLRLDVNQPSSTQTPLRDTETDEPLAAVFNVGAGLVQYTTFHEEPQMSEGQELALVYMVTRM